MLKTKWNEVIPPNYTLEIVNSKEVGIAVDNRFYHADKAVARGGSLGSEEPPPPEKGPPKGPLECTKRSARLHKKVH